MENLLNQKTRAMILTKKQLRKRIEQSAIPARLHSIAFAEITKHRRLMWETGLIRWEQLYLKCHYIRSVTTPTFCETIHHDCKTHNTDHAV